MNRISQISIAQPVCKGDVQSNLNNLSKIEDMSEKFLVLPTAALSGALGVFSFIKANFLGGSSSIIDKAALFLSKLSLFATAGFGGIQTGRRKDTVGTLGYLADLVVACFANSHQFYLWKGIGSSFDNSPAIFQDAAHNPKIKELYDKKGESFLPLTNPLDALKKSLVSYKVILSDITRELFNSKNGNIFQKLKKIFIGNTETDKNRTAERNLLTSAMGMLGGSLLGILTPLHRLGASIRDLFGFHMDLAVFDKLDSKDSEGNKTKGSLHYGASGILYGAGSVLDLIYRWTEMENLNLAAIGADRLAAVFYVLGFRKESQTPKAHITDSTQPPALNHEQAIYESGVELLPT